MHRSNGHTPRAGGHVAAFRPVRTVIASEWPIGRSRIGQLAMTSRSPPWRTSVARHDRSGKPEMRRPRGRRGPRLSRAPGPLAGRSFRTVVPLEGVVARLGLADVREGAALLVQ